MTTKFTKGPWAAMPEEVDKDYIRIRGTTLGGRYKIANVITPVYDGAHPREDKETRGNAHLIAAAPDLYNALETLTTYCEIKGIPTNAAYAALAKARGEN